MAPLREIREGFCIYGPDYPAGRDSGVKELWFSAAHRGPSREAKEMELFLSLQECEVLLHIAREAMDDLLTEIHDTDNREYRSQLRAKEQALRGIIQKLERAALPTSVESD